MNPGRQYVFAMNERERAKQKEFLKQLDTARCNDGKLRLTPAVVTGMLLDRMEQYTAKYGHRGAELLLESIEG